LRVIFEFITTSSDAEGTPAGDQEEDTLQLPLETEVLVAAAALWHINIAKRHTRKEAVPGRVI
jgi:hypothetical protein